jgi:hypothetical protein
MPAQVAGHDSPTASQRQGDEVFISATVFAGAMHDHQDATGRGDERRVATHEYPLGISDRGRFQSEPGH